MSEIDDGSRAVEGTTRPGEVEPAETDGPSRGDESADAAAPAGAEATPYAASDAFAALGNDVRTSVLESLVEREPLTFSDLLEAAPVDTSAGFAYHLRQLDGRFVRKDDEGYRLTHAGRRAARAVRAGALTGSVAFDPIDLEDPCPVCGEDGLRAGCADGDVTVACEGCGRSILTLPLPPGGSDEPPEALLESVDRHTRSRLALASRGNCPECAGSVEAELARPPDRLLADLAGAGAEEKTEETEATTRAQARVSCPTCGWRLATPVVLAVIDHPAVVAFYHEHGHDVRDRPVWNVGEEWRETVLSTDPWCVRVSTSLDDEVLSLLVGRDLTVVETERHTAGAS